MSAAGAELNERVVQLEREVKRLSDELAILRKLIDPDDVRALERMRRNPVTNEQLRTWAKNSIIPEGLDEQPEEKPW
jgi:hypothetical protein